MQNLNSRRTAHELMLASGQSFTTSTPSKLANVGILSPLKYEANLTRAKVFTKRKTTLANDARQTLLATDNSPKAFRSTKRQGYQAFASKKLSVEGQEMPVSTMPHKLIPIEDFEQQMRKPERITFMGETGVCDADARKRGVVSKLKN